MPIGKDTLILEKLLEQIKFARNRMQQLWDIKGCTDDEVLMASIEVDHLLNEYNRITGFSMSERKCLIGSGKN